MFIINFLHTNIPDPVLIEMGPWRVYYYGIFIVSGILAGIGIALKLAQYYGLKKYRIFDACFYLIIGGVVGARVYHVFLELAFYLKNPISIFKLWEGGLAIHGGIIGGLAVAYLFAKKNNISFWQLGSILAPALSLAQAIGRWGNYFNQELFGGPTGRPWGIPIEPAKRIAEYYNAQYFHPAFLYESIINLIIFLILIRGHKKIKNSEWKYKFLFLSYLLMYSLNRFIMEFIRIDPTLEILSVRFPQLLSLCLIVIILAYFYKNNLKIKEIFKLAKK